MMLSNEEILEAPRVRRSRLPQFQIPYLGCPPNDTFFDNLPSTESVSCPIAQDRHPNVDTELEEREVD
jgi:hypothetical protein